MPQSGETQPRRAYFAKRISTPLAYSAGEPSSALILSIQRLLIFHNPPLHGSKRFRSSSSRARYSCWLCNQFPQVYMLKELFRSFATPWEGMDLIGTSCPSFFKWRLWRMTCMPRFSTPLLLLSDVDIHRQSESAVSTYTEHGVLISWVQKYSSHLPSVRILPTFFFS